MNKWILSLATCLLASCSFMKDPVGIQEAETVMDRIVTDETVGSQQTPAETPKTP